MGINLDLNNISTEGKSEDQLEEEKQQVIFFSQENLTHIYE
jgi:hypothetical protein